MYPSRLQWASISIFLGMLLALPVSGQDLSPLSSDFAPASLALRHVPLPLMNDSPDAVVRRDLTHIKAHEVGSVSQHVRRAVTVFSRQGRESFGTLRLTHDTFRSIEDLEGWIVDAEGTVVSELDDDDIRDYPANDGFSLYRDLRVKRAELHHNTYPYTVVFEYTLRRNGHLGWPTWRPHHPTAPVEQAAYIIDTPADMEVRYDLRRGASEPDLRRGASEPDLRRGASEPDLRRVNDRRLRTWTVQNARAWEAEPHGPPWYAQAPAVHVVPRQFAIGDTQGTFATWKAFGNWYHSLTQGRQTLSDAASEQAHAAVASARTRRDSVRALYEHMQSHTRYVSVQLGLGGWQPYPAEYVERTGYGDCKALSNYMQALLEEVGIASSPVLIRSSSYAPPLHADFPENRFNHMILAVPTAQDTLWLETTSQLLPFGHVHRGIADRKALLVRKDNSRLVDVPAPTAAQNQRIRRATVDLDPSGNATASITTTYTGVLHDGPRHQLARASDRARRAWMRDQLRFSTFNITQADFSAVNPPTPKIEIPVSVELPRYATTTASRLFLDIGLAQSLPAVPAASDEPRTQPVHPFTPPGVYADSVTYTLPAGYTVEALPEGTMLETPFATYNVSIRHNADERQIAYRRRFELTDAPLSPEMYDRYRTLLDVMRRTNGTQQAVLVRE
ncbi:hypothetical protein CRI93_11920 [Longimonas halophila]|uniref:DUF3857 domain-containing protein n=1 Tax=Longimonas halophila TaxID=1469170 RepID=A0A2H3NJY1_9BACT|nr:DUF3857 domain-containing protein [Longimonas halophila]PEN05802.1 hypothetical protein CRI93_11920 [Longimonas halophila]